MRLIEYTSWNGLRKPVLKRLLLYGVWTTGLIYIVFYLADLIGRLTW